MPNNHPIPEEAVKNITDRDSLLNFLREHLDWQLPDDPVIEEATFRWDVEDLQVNEKTAQRLQDGTVYQLRPMVEDQPWGIFLIEFNSDRVYKTDLRNVLRGLVPKRRRDSALPAWQHENILFICLTRNNEFTIANFRGEKPERARLIRISWTPEDPVRTLCEYNLPSLRLPDDVETWTDQWHRAFDVEKVTKTFFNEYTDIFYELQEILRKQTRDKEWAHDYALHFLNRVLFLYFIQKKRWLGNDPRFMKSLWDAYRESDAPKDTFYQNWLSVLFFEAFNNKYQNRVEYVKRFPENIHKAFSGAPFLNGGLFAELEIDNKHDFTIADSFFVQLFDRYKDYHTGFLERYNFTITEETPLDQEVAVDPEMIGKVYESLVNITFEGKTEQDRRGMAGIFYTPRVEIDLMCRLSLTDWLVNNLGNDNKTVIRRAVFAYSPEEKKEADAGLTERDLWTNVNDLLNSVTVLDITVGSGSFLVGMLLVIDDLKARANKVLGISETPYERRKKIIGQSLYGVDVMDWAVHVAELRLWLQLVVETELKPAELKFRPLLPNLSFKVRSGDSLVQEVGGINFGLYGRQTGLSSAVRGKLTKLKGEKLNFYYGEHKNPDQVKKKIEHDEFALFSLILREKADVIKRKIDELTHRIENPDEVHWEQLDLGLAPKKKTAQQLNIYIAGWEKEKEKCEIELAQIKDALDVLKRNQSVPFVWDIGFVEIFEGDKKGFDIVIGNPPYVRQEKIQDPKGLVDKKTYKAKLQRSVYEAYPDFFRYKRTQDKALRKIDGKSDLYIYFYFHGLSLLNEKGSFCFITSNSWLDVGYGRDLQEFLLKNVKIKYIIDNEAKRSFAEADINTMICLFSAPSALAAKDKKQEGSVTDYPARFVMFRVSFDETLSPVIFEEIDVTDDRLSRKEFRVVVRKQNLLSKEGERRLKDKVKVSIENNKYNGNKWGGKYLIAPDNTLKLLFDKNVYMQSLDNIIKYSYGLKTGVVDFFYLDNEKINSFGIESQYLKPIITSSRDIDGYIASANKKIFWCKESLENIRGTGAEKYIKWGESKSYHNVTSVKGHKPFWYSLDSEIADVVLLQFWDKRFWTPMVNDHIFVSNNFYYGKLYNKSAKNLIMGLLNSVIYFLQIECFGRRNLGQGVLTIYGNDLSFIRLPSLDKICNSSKSKIEQSFKELCSLPVINIEEDVKRKERVNLDIFVLESIGMNKEILPILYDELIKLVRNRANKAKSI